MSTALLKRSEKYQDAMTALAVRAKEGDRAAFEQLGLHATRFARSMAARFSRQFYGRGLAEEFREEAMSLLGLVLHRAVRSYSPRAGRFERYLALALAREWRQQLVGSRAKSRQSRGGPLTPYRFSELEETDGVILSTGLIGFDNGARREVESQEEARTQVATILEKMDPELASLLKVVYGISVGGEEPREPVMVRDLERSGGWGRNVLHNRLQKAQGAFRELAVAGGMAS